MPEATTAGGLAFEADLDLDLDEGLVETGGKGERGRPRLVTNGGSSEEGAKEGPCKEGGRG